MWTLKILTVPAQKEIRNCHINIGTGKEISIAGLAHLIVKETGYKRQHYIQSGETGRNHAQTD